MRKLEEKYSEERGQSNTEWETLHMARSKVQHRGKHEVKYTVNRNDDSEERGMVNPTWGT